MSSRKSNTGLSTGEKIGLGVAGAAVVSGVALLLSSSRSNKQIAENIQNNNTNDGLGSKLMAGAALFAGTQLDVREDGLLDFRKK
ncbi:hypothetical protein ABW20_dc0101603 [Dactylellina cionopaga]|nr:hypothetical protein ABW20_dc0101603 [Dactylellina cionopaga]